VTVASAAGRSQSQSEKLDALLEPAGLSLRKAAAKLHGGAVSWVQPTLTRVLPISSWLSERAAGGALATEGRVPSSLTRPGSKGPLKGEGGTTQWHANVTYGTLPTYLPNVDATEIWHGGFYRAPSDRRPEDIEARIASIDADLHIPASDSEATIRDITARAAFTTAGQVYFPAASESVPLPLAVSGYTQAANLA
jgi:hypothetical protein